MSKTDDSNGQDDVDVIFGEIVADLRADGVGARTDTDERGDKPAGPEEGGEQAPRPAAPASGWRSSDNDWDDTMLSQGTVEDDDDEHFVPPEPPPLPKPTSNMLVVALFFTVGLVLLIAPHVIGMGVTVGTPLGILSLAAGLGFLLLQARDDQQPPGSDPSNGAQV